MTFKSPDCRAFSRKAQNLALFFVAAVTLAALGVLLHSIWVLRP